MKWPEDITEAKKVQEVLKKKVRITPLRKSKDYTWLHEYISNSRTLEEGGFYLKEDKERSVSRLDERLRLLPYHPAVY